MMQQEQIHLERVTEDNVEAIVKLRVSKEQRGFVELNEPGYYEAEDEVSAVLEL